MKFKIIPTVALAILTASANSQTFHNAPASAAAQPNPATGAANALAGQKLYQQNCIFCHGAKLLGSGNAPALITGPTQSAAPGEIYWLITHGEMSKGMPPWPALTDLERWQIVTYLKTVSSTSASTPPTPAASLDCKAPTCYTISQVDKPPVPLYQPQLDFGDPSKSHELSACMWVMPDGTPSHILIKTPLTPELDEKNLRTIYTWKFRPAFKNGNPVTVADVCMFVSVKMY